jgi:hypothetical protein
MKLKEKIESLSKKNGRKSSSSSLDSSGDLNLVREENYMQSIQK